MTHDELLNTLAARLHTAATFTALVRWQMSDPPDVADEIATQQARQCWRQVVETIDLLIQERTRP
jgi:hypothetical protein